MNSFLLFKLRFLGDVLMTTPSIRLLRRSYPDAHITMVVNKGTEDILHYNPHLNRVLTVDRKAGMWPLLRTLRDRRYQVSVDFASGDRAAWLALLAGVPRRIAFWSPEGLRRFLNNQQVKGSAIPGHTVDLYLSFLREGLGIETNDKTPDLFTGSEDEAFAETLLAQHHLAERAFVIAHLGGRYAQNRWPLENWRQLVEKLPMPLVFVGAAQEEGDAAQLKGISLVGKTTVLQFAALARRAAMFIGHDSGPMHIAAAMGTRAVALFGPTSDPVQWRPWGVGHVVLPTSSSVADVISASVPRDGRI